MAGSLVATLKRGHAVSSDLTTGMIGRSGSGRCGDIVPVLHDRRFSVQAFVFWAVHRPLRQWRPVRHLQRSALSCCSHRWMLKACVRRQKNGSGGSHMLIRDASADEALNAMGKWWEMRKRPWRGIRRSRSTIPGVMWGPSRSIVATFLMGPLRPGATALQAWLQVNGSVQTKTQTLPNRAPADRLCEITLPYYLLSHPATTRVLSYAFLVDAMIFLQRCAQFSACE